MLNPTMPDPAGAVGQSRRMDSSGGSKPFALGLHVRPYVGWHLRQDLPPAKLNQRRGTVAFWRNRDIVPASDYVSTFQGDECRSAFYPRFGRRGNGVGRSPKRDEKGIALRVDLDARVSRERVPQGPPVLAEQIRVSRPVLLEKSRRSLDVREEKGDGSGRKLARAHGAIISPSSHAAPVATCSGSWPRKRRSWSGPACERIQRGAPLADARAQTVDRACGWFTR
jgi:hypothetical protein